ncbi:MAG: BamA/TamA family outer membrane protein [Candidatus Cloacimonetes bacterium]|nr:BamA/TamA family outer membrane protein [Candidatus Cloacimonadota bacterium]
MLRNLTLALLMLACLAPLAAIYYGQNKVQTEKVEWSVIETKHFDIYYGKGEDTFGQIAALMSEEAYYYLKRDFGQPIRNRIPIIFYESKSQFQATNIILPLLSEGVGGFTEYTKSRVVIPFDGSYRKLEEVLVHELTHAYVNAINSTFSGNLMSMTGFYFPFWFQEGLPEFEAIGGSDNFNNMFVIDMTLNDYLGDLDDIGGFYAYRAGESFLTFIGSKWGREKVMELFYAARVSRDLDTACEKVFGMNFRDIQLRWRNWLKREYFPAIVNYDVPYEKYEKRTDHEETMTYMHYAPRFSPDGRRYLYFNNHNMRTSIWEGSTLGIREDELVLKGETTPRFEEFHILRNNIAWYPDSQRFAFVAEATGGDRIYVMDIDSHKVLDTYTFPQLDNIYEIDISHDGRRIVFAGQQDMATDIYVFDIDSGDLSQLTDDRYNEASPRWSPNDSLIAFSSERSVNPDTTAHVFYGLNQDVFYYDLGEETFYQVTDDSWNNYSPMWNNTGSMLLFITESDNIANYEAIELDSGRRARVTNILCGVFTGDLSATNEQLVFACFFNNGWDIYMGSNPLADLEFEPYHTPQPVQPQEEFYSRFDINRYQYFGRTNGKFKRELPSLDNRNVSTFDFGDVVARDSLRKQWNRSFDRKPDTMDNPPAVVPFKLRFSLDRLWGGMAYSPSAGAFGYVQFSMSDLMGDHAFGAHVAFNGEFEYSDIIFNYLWLSHRIDWGFGAFHLNDSYYYEDLFYDEDGNLYDGKEMDRRYGAYAAAIYPLNRFWRVSLENLFYMRQIQLYSWDENNDEWDYHSQLDEELVYSPSLSVVHDNSLFGSTGPVSGWRGAAVLNKSFSNEYEYLTGYTDNRFYLLFANRYSLATRLLGSASIGDNPQKFSLNGFSGVRGYDEDDEGTRKALATAELRFPFIDYLHISFPLPLALYQLRGSAFIDAGAVWSVDDVFRGSNHGRLDDVKMGFGFGPRLNMGFFVLKFDIAWNTDFMQTSKPSYYITLDPDF